jgi:LppP/LprE lipoprotein
MTIRVRALLRVCALVTPIIAAGQVGIARAENLRPSGSAPSKSQISFRLSHTIEVGSKGTHFKAVGKPKTIKDGRGTGTLTAVVGVRYPTADGFGQIVFFWHDRVFDSQSSRYETTAVDTINSLAPGTFVIRYARYRKSDPMCCPTLKPLKVSYGWSGHILISNGVPPRAKGAPLTRYQP